MKKFLLLCFILSSFFGFSQDWQPFPLGQTSYYFNNSYIFTSEVDSVEDFNQYKKQFLKQFSNDFPACKENLQSSYGVDYRMSYNHDLPDSIIEINDSLLFFYNYNLYQSPYQVLFLPKTTVGEYWTSPYPSYDIDSLIFTCTSITYDTIFGGLYDSLKTFTIQAILNGNPINSIYSNTNIVLSKNYGFRNYISFSQKYQVTNKYLNLIGIKSTSYFYGYELPDFNDYFHLSSNDVLIWRSYEDRPIPNLDTVFYYRDSITNVISTTDSVIYFFDRTISNGSFGSSSVVYRKNELQPLFWNTNIMYYNKNFKINGSNIMNFNLIELKELLDNGITFRGFGSANYDLFDTINCNGFNLYGDYYQFAYFNTKYGFYNTNHWYWDTWYELKIIGSTINGIQEGVAWSTLVTGINDIENISNIKIYPNPSKYGVFTVDSEKPLNLSIVSIDGKTVYTQNTIQPKTEVKTNLPKGLYFVHLELENNKKVIQKLIITD